MRDDPYWNHNTHYHPWLLKQVPRSARTALDIGCGDGLLAGKLAGRGLTVTGIDVDPAIIARAPAVAGVSLEQADFLDYAGSFDVVTTVATLHHVPLRAGLTALRRLVAPGGVLAVVGLWKMSPRTDFHYFPLFPLIWAIHLSHRVGGPNARTRDPIDGFAEIRSTAAELLPGARVRRRLMWRYTLLWHKPA
ncbi:class I SAM-dependent methyltransferase [Nocardia implantans]|uniref:Class I SAM-dependent methyltransferase n=1 Tax=Nocardia implantans TaxID=3108168 RepID=A0ABU6AX62_9NOCA|nr:MULTISPECIES: class I SAM-dependent methyltransferase [unclassified Nocardia]MBF6193815.1 class I SAM-dependent methyltransferase [Nocardia beijingensis]MEA3529449.1 class I SAM-dependent methyltransferase [Nocardia sp. CDC192]MEB3512035.1 class I SAM-dependent methyltransferase [Nocardia sp. CDC186]